MQPASMPQPVMMSQHAFKVMALSPEVSAEQPASKKLSEQKISYQKESDAKAGNLGNMTYATVSFIESEIQAEQQRTTAIVQTSDKALDMKPTEELAFAGGHLYAYSYIYNKVSAEMTSSVKTQFVTRIEDEKVVATMDNQKEITMTMWMKADENRTIFEALSPANLEYERMPNQPYKVIDQPVLTFVARQKGEAWNHPFVCVYEPSSDTEPGDIASVDYFTPSEQGAVGIIVKLKNGAEQHIVCSENGKVSLSN